MTSFLEAVAPYVTAERMVLLGRALTLAVVGWILAKLLSAAIARVTSERLEPQQVAVMRRAVFYLLLGLFLVMALHELGFDLSVLLGAAGVLTVAVGFASQTSASNIISGLFLIAERPFGVGDVIQVGGTSGEVLAIDLLSVKLRTFDNTFVRIPNESLIKSEVRTISRFPIRRVDLPIGVAYKEDASKVREVLLDVAEKNLLSLEEPAPLFRFEGFGDSAMNLLFSVWVKRENLLEMKSTLLEEIKEAFDDAGIEIPYPHRTLVWAQDESAEPQASEDASES